MVCYLQWTGKLLENNLGKGATHATHLNNPEVALAVRSWVMGMMPIDEGGFEGRVSVAFAHLLLYLSYCSSDVPMQTELICQSISLP